jgi:ABC-type multidrug transport system ATPase subunit
MLAETIVATVLPLQSEKQSRKTMPEKEYELVTTGTDVEKGHEFDPGMLSSPHKVSIALKPHAGTILEWKDVQYIVPMKEENTSKTILSRQSGIARPGELLAVMGTSGAGKSTLLDVLAGRLDSPFLSGSLLTNGQPIDKTTFRREIGYVMQNDALFPLLTVEETIRYAAYLRIPDKSTAEKDTIVETIISLLRLENCRHTIVGDDQNRGLSGGEKRRVSIAVDIVHFPSIIFLDEPTSGLDSSTALSVVESLKSLAIQQNCTIIMTIHQPSARLFDLLNKVLFLANGKITFCGKVSELPAFIDVVYKESGLPACTQTQANLPETFLDLSDSLIAQHRIEIMTEKYENKEISGKDSKLFSGSNHEAHDKAFNYANNYFSEVFILIHRNVTNILRTKELFVGRLFATIFFGVLISTLFYNTKNTMDGLNHRLAYFVFVIAFYYWTSLEALPIFFNIKEIYQREFSSGAYRALSFVTADILVQMPFHLFLSVLFTCITWWIVALPNFAANVFMNILIVFTILTTGNTFATLISVLAPDPMTGQTMGSGLFSVMFMMSGFFIKKAQIPDYWIWLHYMSLFKYAYDSFAVNGFKDHAHTETMSNAEVLHYYSVNGVNVGLGIGVLWGWVFFFRMIIYYRLITAFTGTRK